MTFGRIADWAWHLFTSKQEDRERASVCLWNTLALQLPRELFVFYDDLNRNALQMLDTKWLCVGFCTTAPWSSGLWRFVEVITVRESWVTDNWDRVQVRALSTQFWNRPIVISQRMLRYGDLLSAFVSSEDRKIKILKNVFLKWQTLKIR